MKDINKLHGWNQQPKKPLDKHAKTKIINLLKDVITVETETA